MSIQAVAWVLENSKSKGSARLVLISLANYASEQNNWECWPAMRTVAREAGVASPSTVSSAIDNLVALGELEVVSKGDSRHSGRYRVTFMGVQNLDAASSPDRALRPAQSGQNRKEPEENTNPSKSRVKQHPEAERLADLLADLIEANGSERPNVTQTWITDIDRMMRLGKKRTPQQVENMIRWCQQDSFWMGNILSAKKLREKYDQMRLKAMQERGRRQPAGQADRAAEADELRRTWGDGEVAE